MEHQSAHVMWQWDANRRDYYYFSTEQNAFVYANGTVLYPGGVAAGNST